MRSNAEGSGVFAVTRLDNSAGTGGLPSILRAERDNFAQANELLKRKASMAELAAFEKLAASRALALLQGIGPAPQTK